MFVFCSDVNERSWPLKGSSWISWSWRPGRVTRACTSRCVLKRLSDQSSCRCWPNIPPQTARCLPSCTPTPHTPPALVTKHPSDPQWKTRHRPVHTSCYLSLIPVLLTPPLLTRVSAVQWSNGPRSFSSADLKQTNSKWSMSDHRKSLYTFFQGAFTVPSIDIGMLGKYEQKMLW